MYMAQKVAQYPAISVIALAATVIVLYSLWGASLMRAQQDVAASGSPLQQLAAK